MIINLLVFIFGSIVGSFLNVCIHRMPFGESVVTPRSHCPKCKKFIPWYDNIPLLSYIILRGRCRFCKEKISRRYFIVEVITAVAFVVLFKHFGLSLDLIASLIFTCGLIIATFVDIAHRIIPDEISLGGIVIGLLLSIFQHRIIDSLLGIIAGAGIIYLTGVIFDFFYFGLLKKPAIDGEKESMGFGDVKLMGMIGAFLGWQYALLTFFIAPLFGAIVGGINLFLKNEHTIPYGPFLSLGAIISLFWGNQIIHLLLFR